MDSKGNPQQSKLVGSGRKRRTSEQSRHGASSQQAKHGDHSPLVISDPQQLRNETARPGEVVVQSTDASKVQPRDAPSTIGEGLANIMTRPANNDSPVTKTGPSKQLTPATPTCRAESIPALSLLVVAQ